jgi:hypothetical protein
MSNEAQNTPLGKETMPSALSEILSNPQMLSVISSMAEKLKSGSLPPQSNADTSQDQKNDSSADTKTEPAAETVAAKLPDILGMLQSKGANESQSRRSELLCALKPYLSQNRSDAIDKIIRLSELSGVFKELN